MTTEAVRCDRCSAEHPTGAGYVRRRGRTLCGTCVAARKHRATREWGLLLWLLFVATAAAWIFDADDSVRFGLTNLSMVYIAGVLTTTVHESGHALAATTMGIRVREVVIGSGGPQILAIGRGLFQVRLLLLPIGGVTRLEPATRAVRTRHIVALVAGPLTELAMLALAWSWAPTEWPATQFRSSLLFMGAASILTNLLIPLPRLGNDGSKLWSLLTMPDDEVAVIAGMSRHDQIVRRLNAHVTGETLSVEELEEMRRFFVERLAQPGLPESSRALESSNLAAVDLILDRDVLRAEADELSRYAYEHLDLPEITAARGSVLVALGRDTEAVPLLERALPHLEGVHADSTRADLALAAIRSDDVFAARHHLAGIHGPLDTPQYSEARRLLGPAELRNVLSAYWGDERTPHDVAALVVRDAGPQSRLIGANIAAYLDSASHAELVSLMEESAGVTVEPDEAAEQLGALVDLLR